MVMTANKDSPFSLRAAPASSICSIAAGTSLASRFSEASRINLAGSAYAEIPETEAWSCPSFSAFASNPRCSTAKAFSCSGLADLTMRASSSCWYSSAAVFATATCRNSTISETYPVSNFTASTRTFTSLSDSAATSWASRASSLSPPSREATASSRSATAKAKGEPVSTRAATMSSSGATSSMQRRRLSRTGKMGDGSSDFNASVAAIISNCSATMSLI